MHVEPIKLQEHIRQYCLDNIKDSGDVRRKIIDFEVIISEEEHSDEFGGKCCDSIKIFCITESLKRKLKNRELVYLF